MKSNNVNHLLLFLYISTISIVTLTSCQGISSTNSKIVQDGVSTNNENHITIEDNGKRNIVQYDKIIYDEENNIKEIYESGYNNIDNINNNDDNNNNNNNVDNILTNQIESSDNFGKYDGYNTLTISNYNNKMTKSEKIESLEIYVKCEKYNDSNNNYNCKSKINIKLTKPDYKYNVKTNDEKLSALITISSYDNQNSDIKLGDYNIELYGDNIYIDYIKVTKIKTDIGYVLNDNSVYENGEFNRE